MKHLKRYKIFESKDIIIDTLNDILLEINDLGFKCIATGGREPDENTYIPIGYKIVKTHDVIMVKFSKDSPGFDWDDISEVYFRIKYYLSNDGWTEEGDLQNAVKNRDKRVVGEGKTLMTIATFTKSI